MLRNRLQTGILVALAILTLGLAGCASTGGTDVAGTPAPGKDIRNETGENGLLTPAAIVARYVDAVGGEKALRAYSSSTSKGKMELAAMGISGDTLAYAAAPDKMVMQIEMGGFGTINQGYNGEVAWADDPMQGARLLEGSELAQAKGQANFYGPLAYASLYPTQETLELTDFEGESAYKVRLVDAAGNEQKQYFSEESGLLLGVQAMQSSPMGEAEVTTVMSDYKDFGGILTPAVITIKLPGMEIKNTVTEVTYDDVAASSLEPPDSIKKLLN